MGHQLRGRVLGVVAALLWGGAVVTPAATLFTEDFENPTISGKLDFKQQAISGWINDYVGFAPERTGLWNEDSGDFTTPDGQQAGWVWFQRRLTTTNTIGALENSTAYTLTFNVGAARAGSTPGTVTYEVQLLAGTSVVHSVSGSVGTNNLAVTSVTNVFTTAGSHPNAGQSLAIRLLMPAGPFQTQVLYDNIALNEEPVADTTSPVPDPMTWSRGPASDVGGSISMVATEAFDASGVEYLFTNTVSGSTSGWQDSRVWTDIGLADGQSYGYMVKARDKSSNENETGWSTELNAVSDESIIFSDDFEFPKISGKHEYNVTPVDGWINDYDGFAPQRTGYWNEDSGDFTTPNGDQAVWVWSVRQLTTTTSFGGLEASTQYTLSFLVGAARAGSTPAEVPYEVTLMAGSNVITTATGNVSDNDLSNGAITHVFVTAGSAEFVGLPLSIRLRMLSDPDFSTQILIDDLKLSAESVADTVSPTPDPAAWRIEPVPAPNNAVTMTAQIASDPSGVEYFFTNTVNGNVSGWQSSPVWTESSLPANGTNIYRVKARDLSSNLNETAWSPAAAAIVDPTLIFYDSFETPVISTKNEYDEVPVPGWSNDYAGVYPERVGLWNEASGDFSTPYGEQAAWIWAQRQLTTAGMGYSLESSTEYTLSFIVGAATRNLLPLEVPYEVELLAGSTVIGSVEGTVENTNLADVAVMDSFVTGAAHPNEGEALAIRLKMKNSSNFQTQVLYDHVALRKISFVDNDNPIPDPAEWAAEPYADVNSAISMSARLSVDVSGVQYFFTNTVNGNVSGWQADPSWTETGLDPHAVYSYRVKTRDLSDNQNETSWSELKSATIDPTLIFVDTFESPRVTGKVEYRDLAVPGWINDYSGIFPERVGLWNEDEGDLQTPFGLQAAWVWSERLLTTTNIAYTLQPSTRYTLTFNVGAARAGALPEEVPYEVHLLAGSNVVLRVSGSTANNDMALAIASGHVTPSPNHVNLGEPLSVRLLAPKNSNFQTQTLYDYIRLTAEIANENDPPTPDPSLWSAAPASDIGLSVTMIAEDAADENGVQYFFTNSVNGNVSGWQDSPVWTDMNLVAGESYTYQVKARDNSVNLNETQWSSTINMAADPYLIFFDSFEPPDHADVEDGAQEGDSAGWTIANGGSFSRAGIATENGSDFSTSFGAQAAWVREAGGPEKRHLVTTAEILSTSVKPYTTYELSFNVAAENDGNGGTVGYIVELVAGTNVVAWVDGNVTSSVVSNGSDNVDFTPDISDPSLGEPLSIRLRKSSGDNTTKLYFDNVRLRAIPPSSLLYRIR